MITIERLRALLAPDADQIAAAIIALNALPALLDVAEAAEFLVGSVELGEVRNLTLSAASQVNQALARLEATS